METDRESEAGGGGGREGPKRRGRDGLGRMDSRGVAARVGK